VLGDNEPLIGDLLEESLVRPPAWLWRQVIFVVCTAVATRVCGALREPQRLAGGLAAVAIFAVLSFQVVVAGHLLQDLVRHVSQSRISRFSHSDSVGLIIALSLAAAWAFGRTMNRLHQRSRLVTVLVCGATAAITGFVLVLASRGEATAFFVPSAAHVTAGAMAAVLAWLVGNRRITRAS
jgi:hypothetical protein